MKGRNETKLTRHPLAHVIRILAVVLGTAVLTIAAQIVLRPADYGTLGPYREGSLVEIMRQEPVHLGKPECAKCHRTIFEKHEKDFHYDVECEDCHGPGRTHVLHHRDADPEVSVADAAMPKEYTLEGCLFCHRRLTARPRTFAQIDPEQHFAFLGVQDHTIRCIECHSPHEPIFLLTRVRDARIHPTIQECDHCHLGTPDQDLTSVEDHPPIFSCRHCHPRVVEDFESRPHAFMRCTSCHLFHFETETAGRITKNGNRRFCLLCHEDKPFKAGARQPLIVSQNHLGEYAAMSSVTLEELTSDPRVCLRCHRIAIHGGRTGR